MKKVKESKKWNKAKILEFLAYDLNANYRALMLIYKLQTTDEQNMGHLRVVNGVGFTGVDSPILTSFAKQYIEKKSLTKKQFEILKKKMKKYANQLAMIANQEILVA